MDKKQNKVGVIRSLIIDLLAAIKNKSEREAFRIIDEVFDELGEVEKELESKEGGDD